AVVADEEPVLTKSTASKGGFQVKSLAEGNYRVTVTKIGYKEKTIQVAVTASEMQDLELVLESA
ncbi:MAG: carboxypeptidase regulatory-like domain-containing protein, partial [Bacteroidales bacterium]